MAALKRILLTDSRLPVNLIENGNANYLHPILLRFLALACVWQPETLDHPPHFGRIAQLGARQRRPTARPASH